MRAVNTVTGPLEPSLLGVTSMHEHVPLEKSLTHREDAIAFAVVALKKAKALGLDTIVEVSPRRDVLGVREVSVESGVNIVVSTGFYEYSPAERDYSEDQFYRWMMDEAETGIDRTGIFPGVIKIASHRNPLAGHEVLALRAAGRVQKATGYPVCVHSVTACRQQQEELTRGGADPAFIYFSHVEAEFGWEGRTLREEIDYLVTVAKCGSVLSYNNFGNVAHTRPDYLLAIIQAMIDEGFADRQVATMDLIWDYVGDRRKILWEDDNPDGSVRTYAYLLSTVIPWLASQGISREHIDLMVVATPRRLLAGS